MKKVSNQKYRPYRPLELRDRTWPDKHIEHAPRWCSVDLRDGNQALIYPMNIEEKLELFSLLVEIGFKQIEVGFPAASDVEYKFLRTIIEQNLVPDDVTIQVLTQAREHLIRRSFEALKGSKNAIVHLYNSTSTLQRDVVFKMDRSQITKLAVDGVKLIKSLLPETATKITLEYSPESFSGTEPDFAVQISNAVVNEWQPDADNKVILNLPATVEMTTPNVYADQVEYFCRNVENRDKIIVSLHTHNDRGSGIAATELGLMAGGDRVEGTLFGNGERTGNVDIVTVALNMFSQGIDPKLDFSDINRVTEVYERTTRMQVHARHPYAGELVFTAFSGSHQDAINKGMAAYNEKPVEERVWAVPYLPIDPIDIGRNYESIIRINSQSGKGGVAYVMEKEFDCRLPKTMHPEFANVIQRLAETSGGEVSPQDIWERFQEEYLNRTEPLHLLNVHSHSEELDQDFIRVTVNLKLHGEKLELQGSGNGPIDAVKHALEGSGLVNFKIKNYTQHSLGEGSDARAIAYIQVEKENQETFYGVGISANTARASMEALFSALNRAYTGQRLKASLAFS
ncbi:MAG: 2-isopropylmalate synthase [Leptospiraceae bacterium]|nr:2-isopropylmalate synthase [Leptospiraceae bacterium]